MKPAEYFRLVRDALERVDTAAVEAAVDALEAAYDEGRRVFVFGNGASAALASHMACDLGKITSSNLGAGPAAPAGRRLRILSLNDNAAWMTALGNDVAYRDVFLEQLKNHMDAGDVVVGISGSGGSENVLRALEYARAHGATTIGLTGAQPKAALIRESCDVLLAAPLEMMEMIEDAHVAFHHAITRALVARVEAKG